MTFSTPPEIQTMRELKLVLAPLGYDVSQKARLLDCVEAAARNPAATRPVGPTLGDFLIPAMRELAGPLNEEHPWLQPGDWRYAFSAHFDFVVHEKLDGVYPTHPLFAVEFDGRSAHTKSRDRARDQRKNRLCVASGLPLMRISDEFLYKREQLSTIAWLTRLWAYHRDEMPRLLSERDAEVDQLPEAERNSPWLLGDHPELDVDLVFEAMHPFPAVGRLARRLADEHGFAWPRVGAEPADLNVARWGVEWFSPPVPDLSEGLAQSWTCEVAIHGPRGSASKVIGRAQVRTGYPIYDDDRVIGWDEFLRGNLPCLPAGPWIGSTALLGRALCLHNLLVNVGHLIMRHDRRNASSG